MSLSGERHWQCATGSAPPARARAGEGDIVVPLMGGHLRAAVNLLPVKPSS